MQVLLEKGVKESRIIFLSLISAPEGIHKLCKRFPRMKVVTSEIDDGINANFQVVPGECQLSFVLDMACALLMPICEPALHVRSRTACNVCINIAGCGEFGDRYWCG